MLVVEDARLQQRAQTRVLNIELVVQDARGCLLLRTRTLHAATNPKPSTLNPKSGSVPTVDAGHLDRYTCVPWQRW